LYSCEKRLKTRGRDKKYPRPIGQGQHNPTHRHLKKKTSSQKKAGNSREKIQEGKIILYTSGDKEATQKIGGEEQEKRHYYYFQKREKNKKN